LPATAQSCDVGPHPGSKARPGVSQRWGDIFEANRDGDDMQEQYITIIVIIVIVKTTITIRIILILILIYIYIYTKIHASVYVYVI